MIKQITIFLAIILIGLNAVQAQDNKPRKELSDDKYTFYIDKKRLSIQYIYEDSDKKKKVHLPEGDYYIKKTEDKIAWFSIDKNGQLCDSTIIRDTEINSELVIYYENGKAIKSKTQRITDGRLLSTICINDSIQFAALYYPSGKVREKIIFYLDKDNAEISTIYDENGVILYESDEFNQIYKTWYPSGNIKNIRDRRNESVTFYNEDGTKSKEIEKSIKTLYFYKYGKLDSYIVEDLNSGETKKYTADGKLIE